MQDVRIELNFQHQRTLAPGQTRAIVVISGKGLIVDEALVRKTYFQEKYFAGVHAKNGATISLKAGRGGSLRLAIIALPAQVSYLLYRNKINVNETRQWQYMYKLF